MNTAVLAANLESQYLGHRETIKRFDEPLKDISVENAICESWRNLMQAWYLAKLAAENERTPAKTIYLNSVSDSIQKVEQQLMDFLLARGDEMEAALRKPSATRTLRESVLFPE